MQYEPKTTPQKQRSQRVGRTAIQGEHGLWYIPGTPYTYIKRADGVFCIYAPGCPEDGLEFATSVPA